MFLLLAAQYESWTLPLAVILIVPMCLLAAVTGLLARGMDVNILAQIGFVVLIGLAAKNAILIVEFARQNEEHGEDRFQAATEAARVRLRPILMTSFAFILGVLPLVIATGAGAEMRQSLGTAVFFGMLGVTFFGLIFTPVFYVVVRKFARSRAPTGANAPPPPNSGYGTITTRNLALPPMGTLLQNLMRSAEDMGLGESVEDRLHRERGEQHTEYPYDHLARGHADQLMDFLGEQVTASASLPSPRGWRRSPRRTARDCPWCRRRARWRSSWRRAGEQRRGEGEHRDLGMRLGLALGFLALLDREDGGLGMLRQGHLQRYGKQDDAAAVWSAASETPSWRQHRPAEQGEQQNDHGGDEHRLDGNCPPFGPRHVGGHRGEQHGGVDRADDGKEGGKRGEGGLEHGGRGGALAGADLS